MHFPATQNVHYTLCTVWLKVKKYPPPPPHIFYWLALCPSQKNSDISPFTIIETFVMEVQCTFCELGNELLASTGLRKETSVLCNKWDRRQKLLAAGCVVHISGSCRFNENCFKRWLHNSTNTESLNTAESSGFPVICSSFRITTPSSIVSISEINTCSV
jgi:hypothetical protein